MNGPVVHVVGAGVAGLCCALELASAGAAVSLFDRGEELGGNCSWFAGGMLSPWCESESAEAIICELGAKGLVWWQKYAMSYKQKGSLVVAQARDRGELARFAKRTSEHERLDSQQIAELEPELAGRFSEAFLFKKEAHLDPRATMKQLASRIVELGGTLHFGESYEDLNVPQPDRIVDCRGLAASDTLPDLRPVKGEMLLLRCPDIHLRRPIRLLHPRMSLYIVPRDGLYMVGATMIESSQKGMSVRSAVELLQAAHAVHSGFADAEIIEMGSELRPALLNNIPRIERKGTRILVNGLYRHGFLLAPELAVCARDVVLHDAHFPKLMETP